MRHPIVRSLGILGVAALCAAPTQCSSFEEVTIPASDSTAPYIAQGNHDDGEGFWVNEPFVKRLGGRNETFLAVVAGYDYGGVSRLSVSWQVSRTCIKGDIAVTTTPLVEPEVETQAPGPTVSNGIWLARSFRPSQYDACPTGYSPLRVTLSWMAEAEDFHGNVTRYPGQVYWAP